MADEDLRARPNRLPWPPLVYLAVVVAALWLQEAAPLDVPGALRAVPARAAGWGLLAAGLGLDLWAMVTLWRARTNILPHRAAGRLVTGGPFALTRNPIYLGNTLALLGLALALANPWLAGGAFLAFVLVDRLAARREEIHLAQRFGAEFAAYARRVPRWLARW